jgi:hypothetical protein
VEPTKFWNLQRYLGRGAPRAGTDAKPVPSPGAYAFAQGSRARYFLVSARRSLAVITAPLVMTISSRFRSAGPIPTERRPCCRTRSVSPTSIDFYRRYVGNIPSASVEAVQDHRVAQRHSAIVGPVALGVFIWSQAAASFTLLSGSPFRGVAQPNRYEPQFLIRHADELGKSIGNRTSLHDIAIVPFEMRGLMPATILGTCLLTMRRV